MMKPNVKGMIGKPYHPKGAYDHDSDGVVSILDCKPYNPYKQGWLHDTVRKKWAEYKEGRTERRAIATEAKAIAKKERKAQTIKTAKYRETIRGEQRRLYYKRGGLGGEISRAFKSKRVTRRRFKRKQKPKRRRYAPQSRTLWNFNMGF